MVTQARALRTPITRKAFCFSLSMMVIYRLGNCLPSRLSGFHILRQLNTHIGSNDDGGGGNSGARCTSSMMAQNSSHSTDTVGNSHRGNTRNNRDQPQFRPKSERQNAARKRKPIHLPPMQLREVFSYSFPFLFVVSRGMEDPANDFLDALKILVSL